MPSTLLMLCFFFLLLAPCFGAVLFFMGMKIEVVDVGTAVVFTVLICLTLINMIFTGLTLRCYNFVCILQGENTLYCLPIECAM